MGEKSQLSKWVHETNLRVVLLLLFCISDTGLTVLSHYPDFEKYVTITLQLQLFLPE